MISQTPLKPGRLRDQQKARTRAKVLEAARAMIVERGFEAATIRDIARRAGVATGSVFTTFSDKTELLLEVVFSRYGELLSEINQAIARSDGDPRARLMAAAGASYAVELREERLLAEALAASWRWTPAIEAEHRRRLEPLIQIIRSAVQDSMEKSQADQDGCELTIDMIFACYLRNFRKALFDNWGPQDLTALLAKQVNRILGPREVIDPCAPTDYEVSLERRLAKV